MKYLARNGGGRVMAWACGRRRYMINASKRVAGWVVPVLHVAPDLFGFLLAQLSSSSRVR